MLKTSLATKAPPADTPAAKLKFLEAKCCQASDAPYFSRSQAQTYAIATTKNPKVNAMKTRSLIAATPS